jgi:hypothetical protein
MTLHRAVKGMIVKTRVQDKAAFIEVMKLNINKVCLLN